MKLTLSHLKQAVFVSIGSLLVAVAVAQVQTPTFLQARLFVAEENMDSSDRSQETAPGGMENRDEERNREEDRGEWEDRAGDDFRENKEYFHPAAENTRREEDRRSEENRNPENNQDNSFQNGTNDDQAKRDAERTLNDVTRQLKERQRELDRNFRNSKTDTSSVKPYFTSWESQMNTMRDALSRSDFNAFWELNQDLNDITSQVNDAFQKLYAADRYGNFERHLKDRERELSDMERSLKDFTRRQGKDSTVDVSPLQQHVDQFRAQINEARQRYQAISPSDPDLQDKMGDLEYEYSFQDANRDFYDQLNELQQSEERVRQRGDSARVLKDKQRSLRDKERAIKDRQRMKQDAGKLESALSQMKELLTKMETLANTPDFDPQDFWDLNGDFDDLDRDFWDANQEFNEKEQEIRDERDLGRWTKDLERELKDRGRFVQDLQRQSKGGGVDAAVATEVSGVFESMKQTAEKARAAMTSGDYETARDLLEVDFNDLRQKFEDLVQKVHEDREQEFARLNEGHDGPDYESFNQVYVDEANRGVSKEILERVSQDVAKRVLEQIGKNSSVFNEIIEKAGGRFQQNIADTLEATSFIPEDSQQELLSRKAAILEQVKEMEVLTARLENLKTLAKAHLQELQAVKDQVAGYNFYGDAGADVEQDLDTLLARKDQLNAGEITAFKRRVAEAIEKARQEKFEQNVIPFLDTDDNEWFTPYASLVKEKGWVKGTGDSGFRKVNPSAETNLAEALTMLGRAAGGADEAGEPASALGKRLPEWARGGAVALERAGVDIDAIFGRKTVGDTVTRAEVARLLSALFKLEPGDASSFKDLGQASDEDRAAIGAVRNAGIMTGEGGSGRFNHKGALNRAALMKILTKASELGQR